MKKLILATLSIFISYFSTSQNCVQPSAQGYLDINDIKAKILNAGDMFTDLSRAQFIVPKGDIRPAASIYGAGLWLSAKDPSGNLKLSAQTFRDAVKNDYWSGPLDLTGSTNADICDKWDKIWQINGEDIRNHVNDFEVDGRIDNEQPDIFGWPGKGNSYFKKVNGFDLPSGDFAPFFDKNKDGIYTPQFGDYPKPEALKDSIIADQMLWCVFNDNGNKHTSSGNSQPLKVEIQFTGWAWKLNDSLINRTVFTSHKIINKSTTNLDSLNVGMWVDFDLGCYKDDLLGSNPATNTFYVYNQDAIDGSTGSVCEGGIATYGNNPPVQTATFLNRSLDKFMLFKNDVVCKPKPETTDPNTPNEYHNLMKGLWKNGQPLRRGGDGYDITATNPIVSHAFPDDPNTSGWSMNNVNYDCFDPRALGVTSVGKFPMGAFTRLDMSWTFHQYEQGRFNNLTLVPKAIEGVKNVTNFYKKYASSTTPIVEKNTIYLSVFPNPTNNILSISANNIAFENIQIFNLLGQIVYTDDTSYNQDTSLNVAHLQNGIYVLKLKIGNQLLSKKVLIQHN
jgi:Secretion system C-terminal sorting domain